ncbi:MAG TPA: TIGR04551 family protein, partial [Anaeromyxobacter sp.]
GAYYSYRTNPWYAPGWYDEGNAAPLDPDLNQLWVKRRAYAHFLDFWTRVRTGRLRVELELVGVYGAIGDPRTVSDGEIAAGTPDPILGTAAAREILLRQWGGALQAELQAIPSKLSLGVELGAASGDDAPGFGNQPNRLTGNTTPPELPAYGSFEGPQWDATDRSIRNFRFNPAYRVDLIGWRELIGQVTDAWYVRPSGRWTILPGLALDVAVIYSQALYAQSTPSASGDRNAYAGGGSKGIAAELDTVLHFDSGTGFRAWLGFGMLQPLGGFDPTTERASTFRTGLAVKF